MAGAETVEYELVPPDGGWGWMIVLGVALGNMTGQCLVATFSLLFGDKLQSLGLNTTSAAVILNTMMAVMQFSGLLTGPLLKKFSVRQVAFSGGCFVVAGILLTSFANSFIHIIITYSIFLGLGSGLVAPSSFIAVKSYFVKARGRAVGMSMAGGNVGQMMMPHLVRFLLENYGFSGAMLVLGGVAMHLPACSLLYQPLEWHSERRPVASELKPLKGEPDSSTDRTALDKESPKVRPPRRFASVASLATSELGDMSEAIPVDNKKCLPPTSEEDPGPVQQKTQTVWRRVMAFMDLDLMRNWVYLNVMFGSACMTVAAINFSLLLPLYLQRHLNLSLSDTALCLTVTAAGDFVSRITVPSFTDRFKIRPRITFFVGAIFCTITRSVIATTSSTVALYVWNTLAGFSRGAAIINVNLCVAEVCPDDKLPAAVGLNMVTSGVFLFTVGPAIGRLVITMTLPLALLCCRYWTLTDGINDQCFPLDMWEKVLLSPFIKIGSCDNIVASTVSACRGYVRDATGDYPLCIHLLTVLLLVAMASWFVEGVVHWFRRKR